MQLNALQEDQNLMSSLALIETVMRHSTNKSVNGPTLSNVSIHESIHDGGQGAHSDDSDV